MRRVLNKIKDKEEMLNVVGILLDNEYYAIVTGLSNGYLIEAGTMDEKLFDHRPEGVIEIRNLSAAKTIFGTLVGENQSTVIFVSAKSTAYECIYKMVVMEDE